MKEVYLLVCAILFVVYIFATKDNPYVPIRKREKPLGSKREIINWYAWKGPMFIEDFEGKNSTKEGCCNDTNPILSDDPTNIDFECCKENTEKRQKHANDFKVCNREAMKLSRTPRCAETSQHSWENKYFNCTYLMRGPNPETGDLGNYTQCTNNNLDAPNQLKCVGLGRIDADTCPTQQLVSHYNYDKVLDKCMQDKGHTKCSLGSPKNKC
jgi:hypothetical protein